MKFIDNLILLVGPSGSGKTTISKMLEKEGLNIIHSYTTREPRVENEWGHTFVDKEFLYNTDHNDMIAFANLYGYQYWATKQQYRGKGKTIYVVCPNGAEEARRIVDDCNVITIFLTCGEEIRRSRIKERYYETNNIDKDNPTEEQIECANVDADVRIIKDREVFKVSKCDYVVDTGGSAETVLECVIDILEKL